MPPKSRALEGLTPGRIIRQIASEAARERALQEKADCDASRPASSPWLSAAGAAGGAFPGGSGPKEALAPRKPHKPLKSLVSDEKFQANPNKFKAKIVGSSRAEPARARPAKVFQAPRKESEREPA